MPNDTRSRHGGTPSAAQAPPYAGSVVHTHDHCAVQCTVCGPDSSAYALGEAVVGALIAVGTMTWWLLRHPHVAVLLTAIAFIGWMVLAG